MALLQRVLIKLFGKAVNVLSHSQRFVFTAFSILVTGV